MSGSTLDPDTTMERDRQSGKGHGPGALGPSDSSDSGSDIAGCETQLDGDAEGVGAAGAPHAGAGHDIGVDRILHLNAQGYLVPADSEDETGYPDLDQLAMAPPQQEES